MNDDQLIDLQRAYNKARQKYRRLSTAYPEADIKAGEDPFGVADCVASYMFEWVDADIPATEIGDFAYDKLT